MAGDFLAGFYGLFFAGVKGDFDKAEPLGCRSGGLDLHFVSGIAVVAGEKGGSIVKGA